MTEIEVRRAAAVKVLQMISVDLEKDVHAMDGESFNGATVGAAFGNLMATVQALAGIVEEHLREVL